MDVMIECFMLIESNGLVIFEMMFNLFENGSESLASLKPFQIQVKNYFVRFDYLSDDFA